ncbi:hypothetical protein MVEN_02160900 [Mycena venus]|uniref:DUF6534 domain-containing protein n=1 Tax=Mycena venus TaxID=2733690 RepID=A0A8H6X8W1_9AGAR|nr:hypothetical protein MVEN_02160900 [Mycena venus]
MPTTLLVPTMGASLIGVFISVFLYGITTLQAFLYYEKYWKKDGAGIKYTVLLVWLLETVHAALACAFIFRLLVLNFNDFAALEVTTVSDDVTHGILGLTIFVVHCFYIRRLWVFTRNIFITGVVALLAVAHVVLELVTMAILFIFPEFKDFHRATPFFTSAVVMAVTADIIIAVAMARNLQEKQSAIKQTNMLLNRLIAYIISTGVLTSVIDIVILVTFLAMPNNLVYLCFLNFINNFYANSMLALLNGRGSLKGGGTTSGVASGDSISMDNIHSRDHAAGRMHIRPGASKVVFGQRHSDEIEVSKTVETHIV